MADYEKYIEKLKVKDEDAFNIIYQSTKHVVYATIVSVVKDRSASEDIMQETYITMLEKINQYQEGRKFLNWLLIIARNKAIDYYRRHKKTILVDPELEDITFPTTSPQGERSILVNEVLNRLNEIERSVFLLRTVQGLKNKDIAIILKMPLGTVLWHYHKAIKKIKEI